MQQHLFPNMPAYFIAGVVLLICPRMWFTSLVACLSSLLGMNSKILKFGYDMKYLIQSFIPGWRIRFRNPVPPAILNSLHGLPVCFQPKRMAALLLFPSPSVLATFRVPLLKFTAVFQSSFLNIHALRTWSGFEKWYFLNHSIITRQWPPIVTVLEKLGGFLAHRCIHVGPGWPRVFRHSQNCILEILLARNHHFRIFSYLWR